MGEMSDWAEGERVTILTPVPTNDYGVEGFELRVEGTVLGVFNAEQLVTVKVGDQEVDFQWRAVEVDQSGDCVFRMADRVVVE